MGYIVRCSRRAPCCVHCVSHVVIVARRFVASCGSYRDWWLCSRWSWLWCDGLSRTAVVLAIGCVHGGRGCGFDGLSQLSKVRPRPAAPRPFGSRVAARDFDVDALDYTKKVLHYSWHPRENVIAVAGLNNLYIYNAY